MRVPGLVMGLLIGGALLCGASSAIAQEYPSKTIRFIVPFNPGGSYDAMARLIGQKLTEAWGQQVVIENQPGTGSLIGTEAASRAAPDGYTLVMYGNNHAVLPSVHTNASFSVQKDFDPVALLATAPNVLLVNPKLPVKTVDDLVKLAKSKPGELNYGSGGVGSITHLGTEMFRSAVDIDVVHVPYKAGVPATMDLIAGQTQFGLLNIFSARTHVEAGKLRPLAITSEERSPFLPDVPTTAEAGIPEFVLYEWYGITVPAGTPKEIVEKLNKQINEILAMPDVRDQLEKRGVTPVQKTPEEFAAFLDKEIKQYAKAVEQSGLKKN